MFQVNDHVVYGNHGICIVKAIGTVEMSSADNERLYYTLEPLYAQGVIYTPVGNQKTLMRKAITEEEARAILAQIAGLETIWVLDEKKREEKYKEIMCQNECGGWLQIIKTLYLKKRKRLSEGKKNTSKDDLYLKLAEDLLYGELADAFRMKKEEVKALVEKRIDELETQLEYQSLPPV